MKTAAHSTYTGPGRVSISLGNPRGAPAGYRTYKKLAPTRDILALGHDRAAYERRFREEVLGKLDPHQVRVELHALTGGAEPVLQCFEKPPFTETNWCHRRMVAEWLEEHLGEPVDELDPESRMTRQRNAEKALTAKGLTKGTNGLPFMRQKVAGIRAEIDAFWERACTALFEVRNWSWMGLPDRIREKMSPGQLDEWRALQGRYRQIDG